MIEALPTTIERDGLTAQTAELPEGFEVIYTQRNEGVTPALAGQFDSRADEIYTGLDPKTVFFPQANMSRFPYSEYPRDEVEAVGNALNTHGAQSLEVARKAFALENLKWLGLASKADYVVMYNSEEIDAGGRDPIYNDERNFVRFPATDIAVVGPKSDEDSSLTLAMGVADCLAIPIVDTTTEAFGYAHAGRPGTGLRTSQRTVEVLRERFETNPRNIVAHLGEGVCKACYMVNEETYDAFATDFGGKAEVGKVLNQYPQALAFDRLNGELQIGIDLYAFNKYMLADSGVGEISVAVNCTARNSTSCVSVKNGEVPSESKQQFYSHERAKGKIVGWLAKNGNLLEFNTYDLTTPRNLAALTRR